MDSIINRWWLLALRGAAAIIFGVLTFVAPLASLFALVVLFGVFALVDGALDLRVEKLERDGTWHPNGWIAGVVAGLKQMYQAALAAGLSRTDEDTKIERFLATVEKQSPITKIATRLGLTGFSGGSGGSIRVKRSPLRSVSRFCASSASICFARVSWYLSRALS